MMRIHPCAGRGVSFTRRGMTAASDIRSLPDQRKIKIEGRSFVGRALHANLASVLLDNPISHRKPQTGAAFLTILGRSFGGEERIVNALNMLLRDSAAGVGDDNAHSVAIRSQNSQRAPVRHRIFGIEEEIQEHLLQSAIISLDRRQVLRKLIPYTNFRRLELVLKQAQGVEDDAIDINLSELSAAGAGEVQQIIHDF